MATLLTRRMAVLTLSRCTGRALSTAAASVSAPSPLHVSSCSLSCNGSSPNPLSSSTTLSTAARSFSAPANAPAAAAITDDATIDGGAGGFTVASTGSRPVAPLSERLPPAFLQRLPKKPAPSVVARRLRKLKTYTSHEQNIRHSPWRLNLICNFAARQPTVPEALLQLKFVRKAKAPLVSRVIKRTAQLAADRDGLAPSQLEVAQCFATHGTHLKRIKFMGRGRTGKKHRRFSHCRVILQEIDFPLRIALCPTVHGKQKWLDRLKIAEADAEAMRVEREELEELEREAAALREERRKKK